MSTFFHFACDGCQERGGFLSRQAWGYGNFDIIYTFKFLAYHIEHCGHEKIRMESEHDTPFDDTYSPGPEFSAKTKDYRPFSDDWSIVAGKTMDDAMEEWEKRMLAEESAEDG